MLFAQFLKDKEHGLVCLFKDDSLWLVQEVANGRPAGQHLFKDRQLAKSYGPSDPADDALLVATKELKSTMRRLRVEEAKVKKSLREMDGDRRRKFAHAKNAQNKQAFMQQEAKTYAANNAAIDASIQRSVRAMLPR